MSSEPLESQYALLLSDYTRIKLLHAFRTAWIRGDSKTAMLSQAPDLNRQLWRKFEEYCRSQLKGGANEAYIITGGAGSKERIGGGKVNVPVSCWKIAVILPSGEDDLKRIDAQTRVVAVLMPNEDGPEIAGGKWSDYFTSVDKIEELTGYDFLSNLPKPLQDALEAQVDSGRARSN